MMIVHYSLSGWLYWVFEHTWDVSQLVVRVISMVGSVRAMEVIMMLVDVLGRDQLH